MRTKIIILKQDNTPSGAGVASVNGRSGVVTLGAGDVGLGNVNNTSDATKNAAAVTLTNKTIDGGSNTITGLTESAITLADVTTLNVSTTKHGFAPKLPNDATKYLDGTGAYSVPAGSGGGTGTVTSIIAGTGLTGGTITTTGTIAIDTSVVATLTAGIVTASLLGSGSSITTKFLRGDNTWQTISGGGDALTSNPLSQFASTTSAQLAGVISNETGTGVLVFNLSPTIDAPTITGIEVAGGALVETVTDLASGTAIDTTKRRTKKSISDDTVTLTRTGSPVEGQRHSLLLTNTDNSNAHTVVIPSSFSLARSATITSVTVPAGGKLELSWIYNGTTHDLIGDPVATTGTGSAVLATNATLVTPTIAKLANLTSNGIVTTSGGDGTLSITATTGSNNVVLSTSPTLVTPVLGTPTSGNFSNCTADGTNPVGTKNVPTVAHSANYTLVLTDAGKCMVHPASDANARTFTIDSHTNVAWADGTTITFLNRTSQVLSIVCTTDTMTLANSTTTGTRSLAQNGLATAVYTLATNDWVINGTGLT